MLSVPLLGGGGNFFMAGPELVPHVPAQYDPMPVLRNLDVPQLWILGSDDTDAPSAETVRRLHGLAAEGRPIVTAIFPHADHGICEYEIKANGTRMSTRNPDGYFAMMCDFILDARLEKRYGTSTIFDAHSGNGAKANNSGR